jgi:AcrR family transcriptional regulator
VASRRTQTERREESEQRLLVAAAEIIGQDGIGAASFERIGKEAGYSRGLASQKFGSKERLFEAVIALMGARLQVAREAALARATSPTEEIVGLMDAALLQVEQDPLVRSYFIMMAAAIANKLPLQNTFLEYHNRFRFQVRDIIAKGQEEGLINRDIAADSAAVAIGSLILGIAIESILDPVLSVDSVHKMASAFVSRALEIAPQPG